VLIVKICKFTVGKAGCWDPDAKLGYCYGET